MSRGNRSRKLDITVGEFLALLLWLPVLAGGETSRSSLRTLRSLRLPPPLLELLGFQSRSQRIYFTTAKNT